MDAVRLRSVLGGLRRELRWSVLVAVLTGPTFGFFWVYLAWLIVPVTAVYLVHRVRVLDDTIETRPWMTAAGVAVVRWTVAGIVALVGIALGLGAALSETGTGAGRAATDAVIVVLVGSSIAVGNLAAAWVARGRPPRWAVGAALVALGGAEVIVGLGLYDLLTAFGVVAWVLGFTSTVGLAEVVTWNVFAALVAERVRT